MRNFGYWRRGGKNAYCRISGATDRGRDGGGLRRGECRGCHAEKAECRGDVNARGLSESGTLRWGHSEMAEICGAIADKRE